MYSKSTHLKTLEEGKNYKVNLIFYEGMFEKKEMIELRGIVDGKEFFIYRSENWDVYLKELSELGKKINPRLGYFKLYGPHDHPLDEFLDELRLEILAKRCMLNQDRYNSEVYIFWGNHEHYSGVFRYFVWDKRLIEKIASKLSELKSSMDSGVKEV